MTRGANRKTRGPGRRLLEIGKDLLIAALVLVNLTLAIMCLPSKTLTQTKWLAGALRPFAGLFGLNEAELTYTAPATGSTIVGAAQPLIITLSTEAGRQSAQYDFAALDELTASTAVCSRRRSRAPRRRRPAPERSSMPPCAAPARPFASPARSRRRCSARG